MADSASEAGNTTLRVLMTADAIGGVWRYSVDLAAALASYDVEILIATMGPRPSDLQRRELLSIANVSLVESDYGLEWIENSWRSVDLAGKWLLELESSFAPDIVHLSGYAHASLPWTKPVIVTAHSCVYSWWQAVHRCAPGREWAEYKQRVAAGLLDADIVVSPSIHMAGELHRLYGTDAEKIRIIHNFTRAHVSPGTKKQPFLLAAGRVWDVAKNLEMLDRIAPDLDWEVRIAGSIAGPESSIFKPHSASGLGALPHTELMEQMKAASIFVHPALYEPFGLAVLEAAQARCCLVLSDIPSLRELWDGAALFIDPREPELWITELNRLARNPQECETLGFLAHSHSTRYRESSSIAQYWDVYASLVRSRAGVAA